MSKVLFFDIDGTLIGFQARMPESTQKALTLARKAGHQVVICSGRSLFQIPPELLSWCDGLVASAGAHVLLGDQCLFQKSLTLRQIEMLISYFAETDGYIQFQSPTGLVLNQDAYNRSLQRFRIMNRSPEIIHRLLSTARITETPSDYLGAQKAVYFECSVPFEKVAEDFRGVLDLVPFSYYLAEGDSGEFSNPGINKSFGMKQYLDAVHVPAEDCFAFGDSYNDLDMIAFAGTGIAMGNAVPEVKQAADFVTKDVTDDGIYYAMEHFGLL